MINKVNNRMHTSTSQGLRRFIINWHCGDCTWNIKWFGWLQCPWLKTSLQKSNSERPSIFNNQTMEDRRLLLLFLVVLGRGRGGKCISNDTSTIQPMAFSIIHYHAVSKEHLSSLFHQLSCPLLREILGSVQFLLTDLPLEGLLRG